MKKLLITLLVTFCFIFPLNITLFASELSIDEIQQIKDDYYDYAVEHHLIQEDYSKNDITLRRYYGEVNGYDIMIISKKLASLTDAYDKVLISDYYFLFEGAPLSRYFYAYKDGEFINIVDAYDQNLFNKNMIDEIAKIFPDDKNRVQKVDFANSIEGMQEAYYQKALLQNSELNRHHVSIKKYIGTSNGYIIALFNNDLTNDDGVIHNYVLGNYQLALTKDEMDNLYVYKDGELIKVNDAYHNDLLGDETIEFIVDALPGSDKIFVDLNESHWGYQVALKAYEYGLIVGYNDHQFKGDENLSRGMVATILYRMAKQPVVTYSPTFKDVASGLWYTRAIIWASDNDIVHGHPNGIFKPDDEIIRQDLAVMLYNYACQTNLIQDNAITLAEFKDQDDVDDYARKAITWCVDQNLMSGSHQANGKYLYPKQVASRYECAKMIVRLYELMK